jgi:hypothetical protein
MLATRDIGKKRHSDLLPPSPWSFEITELAG